MAYKKATAINIDLVVLEVCELLEFFDFAHEDQEERAQLLRVE